MLVWARVEIYGPGGSSLAGGSGRRGSVGSDESKLGRGAKDHLQGEVWLKDTAEPMKSQVRAYFLLQVGGETDRRRWSQTDRTVVRSWVSEVADLN